MMPYSMKYVQKKAKIKIKFPKMKGNFMDSIPCLKSHQPPLISYTIYRKSDSFYTANSMGL